VKLQLACTRRQLEWSRAQAVNTASASLNEVPAVLAQVKGVAGDLQQLEQHTRSLNLSFAEPPTPAHEELALGTQQLRGLAKTLS